MGRPSKKSSSHSAANLGFEAKLWLTVDKLRSNMDAAEDKRVILGLLEPTYREFDAFLLGFKMPF